jgi:hypothetical protein
LPLPGALYVLESASQPDPRDARRPYWLFPPAPARGSVAVRRQRTARQSHSPQQRLRRPLAQRRRNATPTRDLRIDRRARVRLASGWPDPGRWELAGGDDQRPARAERLPRACSLSLTAITTPSLPAAPDTRTPAGRGHRPEPVPHHRALRRFRDRARARRRCQALGAGPRMARAAVVLGHGESQMMHSRDALFADQARSDEQHV